LRSLIQQTAAAGWPGIYYRGHFLAAIGNLDVLIVRASGARLRWIGSKENAATIYTVCRCALGLR